MPDRIVTLENQVQLLMNKTQNLEGQFTDFSQQSTKQFAVVQQQIQQQGQTFHGQLENQTQSVQAMFEAQMHQIRTLLTKRPRDDDTMEWWWGEGPFCLTLWFCLGLVFLACCSFGGSVWPFWVLFPMACCFNVRGFCWPVKSHTRKPYMVLLLMTFLFPIGEASNPGPADQFEDQFTLGMFNPSGLRNKAQFFQSHLSFGDVWTVSETHFYGKDVSRFRSALRLAGSSHRYCITDKPSLRKSLISSSSWKGVAVLAKHPTRAIPMSLPQDVQDSGRALIFSTLLGDAWISGAVVYGEPNGHHYPNYLKNNERLLHHTVSHVCNLCSGPRFVSGDWNVAKDALPAFTLLQAAGFRDLQDVALERWGHPVQNTCKGASRKDFMFISPELQELLIDVTISHDVWPDHSVICGTFRSLAHAPPTWTWPSPHAFPWPAEFGQNIQWQSHNGDMTRSYQQLWQTIEKEAALVTPHQVAPSMMGRAQRLKPKKVRSNLIAPIKLGRQGDFQPEFFGTSVRHSQWVRQVRRLQAFLRLTSSPRTDLGLLCVEAWSAVLRAPGFAPSFSEWWASCDVKTSDAPMECPCYPPGSTVARAMVESLSLAVRQFETQLRQQSRQYARFRRDQNPNLVFADIRPPMVPGVDVLLQPIRAVVEAVDESTGQVTLDSPCEFATNGVISCAGIPLSVIHHEADALWVENPCDAVVGKELLQTKFVGNIADLEEEFVEAWRNRWMRHAEVPPDRWNTILAFVKQHLPKGSFHWPAMTPDDLVSVLRSKKPNTSGGFDGVTVADLKRMPMQVNKAFCDMFAEAEVHGRWPDQLVQGKVVCLAKTPNPATPADFRPITVFSLLYRIWSSFHSRKALQCLDPLVPDELYGNRPGRYAAQIWAKLLWCVEDSFQRAHKLTGLVADLQKVFNMLPRLVIFEIAGHLGIPGHVMVAWAGALSQMRRFLLRGSITKGVPSVTGFPEGCGLSCVAMLLLDTAFHAWYRVYFPLCSPISYVDDWQLICPHSSLLRGAMECLDRFVHAVDLQLDSRKTYAWCLTADGRQMLKQQGFRVVLSAKNLGAHVQFSKKHTNFSLVERMSGMPELWSRMRLSASRYSAKIRAIMVAAWPRALHAVASTTISDALFHSMKAGAMKGLEADGSGCNSWLQLGMVEHPLVDPQFWAIVQTIRCARDCGDSRQVIEALIALVDNPQALPANSISATLLTRLQVLGWHIAPNGHVCDVVGRFDLFHASMNEIVLRAQWAWYMIVAQQVSHRPGLQSIMYADPDDTRKFLRSLPAEERDLFHKCLNGCHITQDGKKYCQEDGDGLCPFCPCSDSRFHRFWECERFEHDRALVPGDVLALAPTLPESLSCYGWSLRPYTLFSWYRMLELIQVPDVLPVMPLQHDVHVFTDGSCLNQAIPTCRVASWAVVLADGKNPMLTHVLDLGPLPGLLQSAYRAEIFAVLRALRCLRKQQSRVTIWTDCSAVVRRLNKLLVGQEPKPNSAHSDLWQLIFLELQEYQSGQIQVAKVAAHQRVCRAQTALEEWCFSHNAYVDQAAQLAQWMRPAEFWPQFASHVQACEAAQCISRTVQRLMLAISKAVISDQSDDVNEAREEVGLPAKVPSDAWAPLGPLSLPAAAIHRYGEEIVRHVLSWFWQSAFGSGEEVVWVSQFHLYVDFLKSGGDAPTNFCGWKPGRLTPHLDLLSIPFQRRVRWLCKVLKECLKHGGWVCKYAYCRPYSQALNMHTGCLAIPWAKWRLEKIDQLFFTFAPAGIHRCSKGLEGFPIAVRDDSFEPFLLSSV